MRTINVWSLQIHSNSSLRSVSIVFRPRFAHKILNRLPFSKTISALCQQRISHFTILPVIHVFPNVYIIYKGDVSDTFELHINWDVPEGHETPPCKFAPYYWIKSLNSIWMTMIDIAYCILLFNIGTHYIVTITFYILSYTFAIM